MSKKKFLTEEERLQERIKELESTNKVLRKRLKKLESQKHIKEFEYVEVEKFHKTFISEKCPECESGDLDLVKIANRVWKACKNCAYRTKTQKV